MRYKDLDEKDWEDLLLLDQRKE